MENRTGISGKRWKRLFLSVLLAEALTLTGGSRNIRITEEYAWWGSLYPKFCLVEAPEKMQMEEGIRRPKISFYLAKLLDW